MGFDLRNVDRVFAGSTPTTTVAIDDVDDPEVSVRFVKSRYSVAEGGDGHRHGRAETSIPNARW